MSIPTMSLLMMLRREKAGESRLRRRLEERVAERTLALEQSESRFRTLVEHLRNQPEVQWSEAGRVSAGVPQPVLAGAQDEQHDNRRFETELSDHDRCSALRRRDAEITNRPNSGQLSGLTATVG